MKQHNSKKVVQRKRDAWFVPVRGSYLPATWRAWLLYIPYSMYIVATLILVADQAVEWMDYLVLVPYWVAGIVIMNWIAQQKS